jgi:arginyl-tRNA synthetase
MVSPEQIDPVLADLAGRLRDALSAAGLPDAEPALERPRNPDHGDWATPVALGLAREAKAAPRDIAARMVDHLDTPDYVEAMEIAGPGFVNFRFAHSYFEGVVRRVLDERERYGRREREPDDRLKLNVEFVSANPTGPLHVGHGRRAAEGDAIAALLEADGHEVTREYYFNDAGGQMLRFGESVLRAHRGESLGDSHYHGEYIGEIAAEIAADEGQDFFEGDEDEVVLRLALEGGGRMINRIRTLLHDMGVDFDVWFSERELHDSGALKQTIDDLRDGGHAFEEDGALFLRTTTWGDDKDRVLIKSDGSTTYFAADCAYMRHKLDRGFDRVIYLLGADHHGYVGRLKAIGQAIGAGPDAVEVPIGQFVNLTRGGEPVRMSKRAGDYVTLDELIEEVGVDVARYHFLRVSMDQTIDFDLEEVVKQSMENPIYYVQYAHARIASILRNADESGFEAGRSEDAALDLLTEPTEQELLRRLAELPEIVAEAADLRAPHRLARYAEDLAGSFHRFYTECRVLGVEEELGKARYWLAIVAKQVLVNAVGLLRVSAPDRM